MSKIRNATSTRRTGRRPIRGVVLLAGLLGGAGALAASGVPAYAAPNRLFDFSYDIGASTTSHPSLTATGAPPALDAYVTPDGIEHVNYIGTDGKVHEFYHQGNQWFTVNLNAPDSATRLAREHYRELLAQAGRRQRQHQHGRMAASSEGTITNVR